MRYFFTGFLLITIGMLVQDYIEEAEEEEGYWRIKSQNWRNLFRHHQECLVEAKGDAYSIENRRLLVLDSLESYLEEYPSQEKYFSDEIKELKELGEIRPEDLSTKKRRKMMKILREINGFIQ